MPIDLMRVRPVEGERATARMLAKGLREHAYAVDVAYDGAAAWARLTASDYDIVVLDVMLPRRSGLGVRCDLRASGRHVPVPMPLMDSLRYRSCGSSGDV